MARRTHQPAVTRQAVLDASYEEFYLHGFQGGSLNRIVTSAGLTKGALFHHFPDKSAIALALVEERLTPGIERRWLQPLRESEQPIDTLLALFRDHVARASQGGPDGSLAHGCPIGNLATEMSPLDENLRDRLDTLYSQWRGGITDALKRGQEKGTVHASIDPEAEATFLVGTLTGTATLAKTARNAEPFRLMLKALEGYLETLRAPLK